MKKTSRKSRLRVQNINLKLRKNKKTKIREKTKSLKLETIIFPIKVSLFVPKDRKKILKMLRAIETSTYSKYYLDFSKVKIFDPLTALYIKHYLDKYPQTRFKSKNCKDIVPRGVFKVLELNKYFGLIPVSNAKYNTMVDDWNVASGINNNLSDETKAHLVMMKGMFKDSTIPFKLTNAMMEAITNVRHHAYSDENSYNKWFLLTHVNTENKTISVVVSDLGASVPATTPVTVKERLKKFMDYNVGDLLKEIGLSSSEAKVDTPDDLRSLRDSELLKIATRLNSTRTKQHNRGKGFNDILSLSREAKDFEEIESVFTYVLSRHGSYTIKTNSDGSLKERTLQNEFKDFVNPIKGTVISWTIQLA